MSQKYRRSLLVFYLDQPPKQGDRGQDFRSLPGQEVPYNANLDALIRDLKTRQSLVKSLLEDEDALPLPFIGSAGMQDGSQHVAQSIISTLGFSLQEFRAAKDTTEAFKYLRQRVEASGIFVLLLGDLGSHHTAFPVESFRGFVIADPIAPFVVINGHDVSSARSFTVLHEVAHLWLGTTGISGSSDEVDIERFCNEVAGAILLPAQELTELRQIQAAVFDNAVDQISAFASNRNLSRAMVAYNLLKAGHITETRWQALRDRFDREWAASKEKAKGQEAKGKGGPSYYVVQRQHIGQALLGLVNRSISGGTVSPTKAARILGVKPGNVAPLLSGGA
jgi:Zn-dependent peptidase ImmA (M78 family)